MRPARLFCALALLLLVVRHTPADPGEATATIAVPEADVWSLNGTGPSVYATGKLHQGSAVTVVKTLEGGWLAIKPPEGSIDWINDQAVTISPTGVVATVKTADAQTRIGVSGQADAAGFAKASIQGARLQMGTLVMIAGPAITGADGSKWWPIQPPAAEERYLRAEALKPTTGVQTVSSTVPGRPAETAPALPYANEPLWVQAQQAEATGNLAEAIRLYDLLARQTPNRDLQYQCCVRIQYLQQRLRGGYPAQANYPGGIAPAQPPPSQVPPGTPPGPISPGQAPAVGYPPTSPTLPAQQASGRGWLRRAGFYLDNKPTYVLQSTEGRPTLYVTAQGQLNLESFLYRNVELYGPIYYRGDVKANYMTAVQAVPVP